MKLNGIMSLRLKLNESFRLEILISKDPSAPKTSKKIASKVFNACIAVASAVTQFCVTTNCHFRVVRGLWNSFSLFYLASTTMLGYINDCVEKFVIEHYGKDVWHQLKETAGVDTKDGGFLRLERYTDQSTIALVKAASDKLNEPVEVVYEKVGKYFVHYIGQEFESMMSAQGSTLFDWLCNINTVHRHLKMTFPNKMNIPEFWCAEEDDGSLTLYLHSKRGSRLAPLAAGIVKEAATVLFGLSINMEMTQKQGKDSKFTRYVIDHLKAKVLTTRSWRITTSDKVDMAKLISLPMGSRRRGSLGAISLSSRATKELRCPMTGLTFAIPKTVGPGNDTSCPIASEKSKSSNSRAHSTLTGPTVDLSAFEELSSFGSPDEGGLSGEITAKLFPYHIRIDEEFSICGYGNSLYKIIDDDDLLGQSVCDILQITSPLTAQWTSTWMRKLENQAFKVTIREAETNEGASDVRFNASLIQVKSSPIQIMIMMNPDVNKLQDLKNLNLTLSDLPIHGSVRESLFLGEHLSSQMNNTIKLEKMKQTLEHEKSLLEELLPEHAAEGLRTGKAVEPRLHENVSLFFSDIVGFTGICSSLEPAEVIRMLNRLYSVMDYLATKFDLFKGKAISSLNLVTDQLVHVVETIGDAYFCASGLPDANEDHARNITNFAIAVRHCCRLVLIPSTAEPLKLRIGIHSGSCASGVVGALNPRCKFNTNENVIDSHIE